MRQIMGKFNLVPTADFVLFRFDFTPASAAGAETLSDALGARLGQIATLFQRPLQVSHTDVMNP